MRRKKKEKLAHENFWATFAYFNFKSSIKVVPTHVKCANFRLYGACDEDLWRMVQGIETVDQLDLDETEVTNEGMKHLIQLKSLCELRLKGCWAITNAAMEYICQINGLELLHLHGTQINTDGLEQIGELKSLKRLLIEANREDPKLEDIYASLPKDCEMTVNYRRYPFQQPDKFNPYL